VSLRRDGSRRPHMIREHGAGPGRVRHEDPVATPRRLSVVRSPPASVPYQSRNATEPLEQEKCGHTHATAFSNCCDPIVPGGRGHEGP
jgi:hypothetical protein